MKEIKRIRKRRERRGRFKIYNGYKIRGGRSRAHN